MIKLKVSGSKCEVTNFIEWLTRMPRVKLESKSMFNAKLSDGAHVCRYVELSLTSVEEFLQGIEE